LEQSNIVVFPVVAPRFSLDELLTHVAAENLRDEVDTDAMVGGEAW
jgi:antitoxin component of MazEF toxin-antitoxin module